MFHKLKVLLLTIGVLLFFSSTTTSSALTANILTCPDPRCCEPTPGFTLSCQSVLVQCEWQCEVECPRGRTFVCYTSSKFIYACVHGLPINAERGCAVVQEPNCDEVYITAVPCIDCDDKYIDSRCAELEGN